MSTDHDQHFQQPETPVDTWTCVYEIDCFEEFRTQAELREHLEEKHD